MRVPSYVKEEEILVLAAAATQAAFAESTADKWDRQGCFLMVLEVRILSLNSCSALETDAPLG